MQGEIIVATIIDENKECYAQSEIFTDKDLFERYIQEHIEYVKATYQNSLFAPTDEVGNFIKNLTDKNQSFVLARCRYKYVYVTAIRMEI